ncbi:DUF192 domain-containing protein [Methyloversatilis sp. XJ19-49]|uniref:DUF192 domain-containing protein n=1 Tax=Methyloversatilis sp. XJ19-49 TaxID=2963429 RepID=UPI00211CCDBA|nr:DUF192 domain-containing protein [Methyloversatilis sp. XJ19-49]MCQ9379364.1 DUF192 domain-containing protein [Methyloversatilis sp. XJ19-49]
MIRRLFCLLWIALSTGTHAAPPAVDLAVGMYRVKAEVARTQSARMTGLMHRTEMPADAGMLFVFPQVQTHCMWMRNTLIPLSVAFIDAQGVVINIADMTPHDETSHCATRPARYALETNAGWFASRKLTAGAKVAGLERIPAPE